MTSEYTCPSCNGTFREHTVEAILKRAAAHHHEHHGSPESITPEIEAGLRTTITNV